MQLPAWTDFPMPQLGDRDRRVGRVRAVTIVQYDGGDIAKVRYGDGIITVKASRLYPRPQRARLAPGEPQLTKTAPTEFLSIIEDSAYMRIKRSAWLLLNQNVASR